MFFVGEGGEGEGEEEEEGKSGFGMKRLAYLEMLYESFGRGEGEGTEKGRSDEGHRRPSGCVEGEVVVEAERRRVSRSRGQVQKGY